MSPRSRSATRKPSPPDARVRAVDAIERQLGRFPELTADEPDTRDLSEQDRGLSLAIYRTTVQRWLTIEHLLGRFVRGKWAGIEPRLRAIMMTAAAQVLFFDGVPAYAAVDEAVEQARRDLREGAAKMTNAVLRRLVRSIAERNLAEEWTPDATAIPIDAEHLIRLDGELLPDPADRLNHLAAALSHPTRLLATWLGRFDIRRTRRIALHGLQTPPLIVHTGPPELRGEGQSFEAHQDQRFGVWAGSTEALRAFLAEQPQQRWVQDPAAATAVDRLVTLLADRRPQRIIDYCAGSGTKTRQLALAFPDAKIIATDPDAARFSDLQQVAAIYEHVEAVPFERLADQVAERGGADAILLDVPCSNTGVLARRIEARYRYSKQSVQSLVDLQRRIVEQATKLLASDGTLAYSTCSIDRAENQTQSRWAAERLGKQIIEETGTLPRSDAPHEWHDGAYVALLR